MGNTLILIRSQLPSDVQEPRDLPEAAPSLIPLSDAFFEECPPAPDPHRVWTWTDELSRRIAQFD